MGNVQKTGGVAALVEAAAYVAGMIYFTLVVNYAGVTDPAQKVALLANNQAGLYLMNLLIYVVFGAALVILALALHERLKAGAPALMQAATAFGLIWAGLVIASGMIANIGAGVVVELNGRDPSQAAAAWSAISAVTEGLGGGNEIVGGLWALLVSWAALRAGGLPRLLNYLGAVVGLAGILSAIPALGEIGGALFGLGQVIWFAGLGIIMLRSSQGAAQEPSTFELRSGTS